MALELEIRLLHHVIAPLVPHANALRSVTALGSLVDRVVEMPWGPKFKRKVLKWLRRYRRGMFKSFNERPMRWTTNSKRRVVIAFQVHYGQLHWALEMLNL